MYSAHHARIPHQRIAVAAEMIRVIAPVAPTDTGSPRDSAQDRSGHKTWTGSTLGCRPLQEVDRDGILPHPMNGFASLGGGVVAVLEKSTR